MAVNINLFLYKKTHLIEAEVNTIICAVEVTVNHKKQYWCLSGVLPFLEFITLLLSDS